MRKAYLCLTSFVLLGLLGCEDYFFPYPYDGVQKLAIHCTFNPDSVWKAQISPVFNTLEQLERHIEIARRNPINDAKIEIYKDDILLETLKNVGNFSYASAFNTKPVASHRYKIKVHAKGYPILEGESTLVDAKEIIKSFSYKEIDEKKAEVTLTIQDPPNERNYYTFDLYKDEGDGDDFISFYAKNDPSLNANSLDQVVLGERFRTKTVFADELFDGQARTFKLTIDKVKFDKLYGLMRVMNEDLFRYWETNRLAQQEVVMPFSEPIRLYSNVKNGVGIFSGYIRLKTPEIRP